jgi:hypothetical protein
VTVPTRGTHRAEAATYVLEIRLGARCMMDDARVRGPASRAGQPAGWFPERGRLYGWHRRARGRHPMGWSRLSRDPSRGWARPGGKAKPSLLGHSAISLQRDSTEGANCGLNVGPVNGREAKKPKRGSRRQSSLQALGRAFVVAVRPGSAKSEPIRSALGTRISTADPGVRPTARALRK